MMVDLIPCHSVVVLGLFAGDNEIYYQETVVTLTVAMNDVGFMLQKKNSQQVHNL
jgi:hypothetical protein